MKQIPNLFTLLNLCFGCIAILYATNSDLDVYRLQINAGNVLNAKSLCVASFFIFLSAVVDFCDGFVARLFHATSAMGAQLDSLADAVSFGVAPSIIIYQLLKISLGENWDGYILNYQTIVAFFVACAAVWRLAKFNIDKEQTYYFKGVPTPAAGLMIASFPLILYYNSSFIGMKIILNPYILYLTIILVSVLMVSNIPLISLKFKNISLKDNWEKVILLLVAIVSALLLKWMAVPIVFFLYVILSLISNPKKKISFNQY
ncbi:MAG: CDP-alcohol phosphatidyltransferase [Chitinophagaceae bacterium]|nr:MAG: CDP-alcohol phosphatidyltransferase [Chitinophagaceae bacterium]